MICGGHAQGPTIRSVNVISIPSDHYLSAEDLARMRVPGLAIEHQAPVEPVIEQSASIDQEIVPRSAEEMSTASVEEEKQLIDKLTIEIRELAQRAERFSCHLTLSY